MKKNIGTEDRIFRGVIAALLLAAAWYYWSLILLLVGIFVAYEALASWCVMYQLLGKNSCPLDKR